MLVCMCGSVFSWQIQICSYIYTDVIGRAWFLRMRLGAAVLFGPQQTGKGNNPKEKQWRKKEQE